MAGLICPTCSQKMSFWTFFTSTTPWHMKCKNCKTKLKIKTDSMLTLAPVFIILLIFAVIIGFNFRILGVTYTLLLAVVFGLASEVILYILALVSNVELVIRK